MHLFFFLVEFISQKEDYKLLYQFPSAVVTIKINPQFILISDRLDSTIIYVDYNRSMNEKLFDFSNGHIEHFYFFKVNFPVKFGSLTIVELLKKVVFQSSFIRKVFGSEKENSTSDIVILGSNGGKNFFF
jgi:hypothetical protein